METVRHSIPPFCPCVKQNYNAHALSVCVILGSKNTVQALVLARIHNAEVSLSVLAELSQICRMCVAHIQTVG